jgi:peptidoglycan/xylan/chitin deacetylase (PgdA/CDA1 family)
MKSSSGAFIAAAFFVFLFPGILVSCASRPSARTGLTSKLETGPEDRPEEAFEAEDFTPMDQILRRIKANSRDIGKYFFLNEDTDIIVKADIDNFEVLYNLRNIRPLDGSRFAVDFSVENKDTGERRWDFLWWIITEDDSGILLAFDDDYQSVWEQYFDLFDRYGARVTFFVQGDFDPFCLEARNRGHDIGYHTRRHLNLLRVSREIFFEETSAAVDTFRQAGVPLRSFAYPFGLSEPWMHEELAKSFSVLRGFGVTYRIYTGDTIRAGYISSKSIDNVVYKNEAKFESDIALMLRTVKFLGGGRIVPLTTHTIADDADWGISPRRLEYVLKTAAELKLRFYRYGDF